MPSTYTLNKASLLKILLHSAAYPSNYINGLLIGTVQSKAAASSMEEPGSPRRSQDSVDIIDVLPLFHTSLSLAPMTEVALIQADAYAHSKGLQLVGYYQANAHIEDLDLGAAGKKIAERIQSHTHQACAVLVDNSKLKPFLQQKEKSFLQLNVKEGNKAWTQPSSSSLQADTASVPQQFLAYHAEGRHHTVVDFDSHLSDIKKDWFNADLLR